MSIYGFCDPEEAENWDFENAWVNLKNLRWEREASCSPQHPCSNKGSRAYFSHGGKFPVLLINYKLPPAGPAHLGLAQGRSPAVLPSSFSLPALLEPPSSSSPLFCIDRVTCHSLFTTSANLQSQLLTTLSFWKWVSGYECLTKSWTHMVPPPTSH